ncbi:MAG: hypothetical protein C0475_03155 [Planctomyces sp.]|nr:hypothetical protein [Planctomyces sp.]MBA4120720.1 hypothetical protein [Isosphaera sp.]
MPAWDADEVLSAAADALEAHERALIAEQAVYGLEALDETDAHPVLAAGLAVVGRHGCRVLREQPYPSQWLAKRGRKRALPQGPDRLRCDLALLPYDAADLDASGAPRCTPCLADTLRIAHGVADHKRRRAGTLFEGAHEPGIDDFDPAQPNAALPLSAPAPGERVVASTEAYWLEVKLVGQHCYRDGVPGPNTRYASELTRGVIADLRKLRRQDGIAPGARGVLLVVLCAERGVMEGDTAILVHRCLDRGVGVRWPRVTGFAVPDRIGNRWCGLALLEPTAAD